MLLEMMQVDKILHVMLLHAVLTKKSSIIPVFHAQQAQLTMLVTMQVGRILHVVLLLTQAPSDHPPRLAGVPVLLAGVVLPPPAPHLATRATPASIVAMERCSIRNAASVWPRTKGSWPRAEMSAAIGTSRASPRLKLAPKTTTTTNIRNLNNF